MAPTTDHDLLEVTLNSWDRNNQILVNLLRALPQEAMAVRAMPSSPSVAEMFTHMDFVRLVFLAEDAPEFGRRLPSREWEGETEPNHIASRLENSAKAVREAVESRIRSAGEMNLHYDHPLLFLQHMIWHEGYHHGQIKLALKLAGHPLGNDAIGPLTWRVWMNKTHKS